MKKITILVIMLLGSYTFASADVGLRLGVAGAVGVFEASGSEKDVGVNATETNKSSAAKDGDEILVGLGSIFIEKTLGFLPGPLSRLSVGYDWVVHDVKTGSQNRTDSDLDGAANAGSTGGNTDIISRSASATISDINTLYVTANITDWLFVKFGSVEMDVKSTDSNSLDGTSTYGSASIDGTVYGIGIMNETENGFGYKLSWEQTDLDGATLNHKTNANNSIKIESVEGATAKAAIYKSF